MRKALFWVVLLLMLLMCTCALSETHVIDSLRATIDIPDTYILLTSDNLNTYKEWLEGRGMSLDEVSTDFEKRGILMQCWSVDYDACFELTALQTERSRQIFDVNEQDTSIRASYRLSHYPENLYTQEGYDFSSADWKNTSNGRFLVMRYIKRDGGEIIHRGLMRRTIRNGYEITFDMHVYDRSLTNKDNTALNKIWESFKFVEILPLPPSASAKINITDPPPQETNTSQIVIQGTAAPEVKLTAVMMGLSSPNPIVSEIEVPKSGKFKIPLKLPKEGVFLITLTGEYQGEEIAELAYPVTYQNSLLTINVTSPMPDIVTSSDVVIQGTSEPGASIQVFYDDAALGTKRSNAAGRFKIEIDADEEGDHEITLVFAKKGLADRRITYPFTRKWTEADMLKQLKKQAINPGYSTLINKMSGYEGRVMGYRCYMLSASQAGDGWIVQMALAKKGKNYTNQILVLCNEAPAFAEGERVMMYGTCAGMSLPGEEDDTQTGYPCFELLLFASLE